MKCNECLARLAQCWHSYIVGAGGPGGPAGPACDHISMYSWRPNILNPPPSLRHLAASQENVKLSLPGLPLDGNITNFPLQLSRSQRQGAARRARRQGKVLQGKRESIFVLCCSQVVAARSQHHLHHITVIIRGHVQVLLSKTGSVNLTG